MFRVLALAAVVAFAPVALLPVPARAQTEAQATRALDEIAAYGAAYQGAIIESGKTIGVALEGVDHVLAAFDAGKRPDRAWLAEWETRAKKNVADLRALEQSLPPMPREALLAAFGRDREAISRINGYEEVGVLGRQSIRSAADFSEDIIVQVRGARLGDDEAIVRLARKLTTGARLVNNTDLEMLKVSIAVGMPGHPQTELARTTLPTSQAIDTMLEYQERVLDLEQPSTAELAAKLRAQAGDIRKYGALTKRRAVAVAAEVKATSPRGPLVDRVLAAMATYDASVEIEFRIAANLEDIAAKIEGGADPIEIFDPSMIALDALMAERTQAQARRIALLAS